MPPSINNKNYQKNKRSRNFSLISYLDGIQIEMVLSRHNEQIKACAYIKHDKDVKEDGTLKEPHYHILLLLHNALYENTVRNWFYRFQNSEGDYINTTSQVCRDVVNTYRYLIHSGDCDKYQYNINDIQGVNLDYFKDYDLQTDDVALNALNDLLNGISYRKLFSRYGRDVIYHINQIQQAYIMCRLEEKGKSIEDVLEYKNLLL